MLLRDWAVERRSRSETAEARPQLPLDISALCAAAIAFSSEVDSGPREEKASKQKLEPFRF
jgi:hypothetical protein